MYRLKLHKSALDFLQGKKLDPKEKFRINEKLKILQSDGLNFKLLDLKKLKGSDDAYRIRVGDFRIIFFFEERENTFYIQAIGHRREIYR